MAQCRKFLTQSWVAFATFPRALANPIIRTASQRPQWHSAPALLGALLQDLLSKVIPDLRVIVQLLVVRVLQQLRVALAQARADGLLYPRIVDLPLPRSFPVQKLVNR